MKNTFSLGNVRWIKLQNPTSEEVGEIANEFGLDPFISRDLHSPSIKSQLRQKGSQTYLVLHLPVFRHSHTKGSNIQEIDFVLLGNTVITTQYDTIDSIDNFAKSQELKMLMNKPEKDASVPTVFFAMVHEVYHFLFDEIDSIDDQLRIIEAKMFDGKEKEMVHAISTIHRTLLDFKRALTDHDEILVYLRDRGSEIYGEIFRDLSTEFLQEYRKIMETVENNRDTVVELRGTNDSLLTTKQNEIMKTLTIMAFVTFPLSLVAGIFGMNTLHMPFVGHDLDFWIILGVMFLATIFMFAFFKYKKWI